MRFRSTFYAALAALLGVVTMLAGVVAAPAPAGAVPTFTFTRLAGANRYDTARVIATATFATADTVVLATGENFPDALAGAYLAGFDAAPVLLTTTLAPVPQETLDALATLKTKTVVILGGVAAVSQAVQDQLAATATTNAGSPSGTKLTVTRIQGTDRYQTMKMVAETPPPSYVGTIGGVKTAIVTSGANFPDALSAGPVAFARKLPTLLTDPATLSPETAQALADLSVKQVLILGGTAAVSAATEASINALGVTTLRRFAGADRSDTSRLVGLYAISTLGFTNQHFNVATGQQSSLGADALSGAPHGGRELAPNLVTNSADDPGAVIAFASAESPTEVDGHIYGGTAALPDATVGAITTAARGSATSNYATVTPSSTSASQGGTTTVTVAGRNITGISVAGCGTTPQSVTPTMDASGQSSNAIKSTIPVTQPVGPCNLTFTTTFVDSSSAVLTVNVTVGPPNPPPAPPSAVTATITSTPGSGITLTIGDSSTPTVSSYNVYRANVTGGACPAFPNVSYVLIGSTSDTTPLTGNTADVQTYQDKAAFSGQRYCYGVASVDQDGQQSSTGVSTPSSITAP